MKTIYLAVLLAGVAMLAVGCTTQAQGQAAGGGMNMKMAKSGCMCSCPMMKPAPAAEEKKCDMMMKHDHAKDVKPTDAAKPADGATDHSQHQH